MDNYQKALVEEHSNLVVRIQKLHDWIYSDKPIKDDKVEFANKCIQLAAMKKYEEALRARIENIGITFENGNYFEHVAAIKVKEPELTTTAGDSGNNNAENEQ